MYYLNCFFIYSILGHVIETVNALLTGSNFKSGILFGWWTPVYGIGSVTILFISNYLFKNLHMNRIYETIIMFFVVAVVLSTLEALGGVIIEKTFDFSLWNYQNHKYNIGKYVSLGITALWGVLSIIFIYIVHPLLNEIIKKVPKWLTVIFIILFVVDNVLTIIIKKK
ncbi:MAG: putative ABC transporter permease [Bacilli bacterium]